MKTINKSALGLSVLAVLGFNASAADIEGGTFKQQPVQNLTAEQQDFIHSFKLDSPLKSMAKANKQKPSGDVTNQAAASGISYFEIVAVGSSQYGGYEYPSASQYSTTHDHGGSVLYVVVGQIGYGNPNNATMNGVSRSAFYTENLCGNDYHTCNPGETVTGFYYYYDFSGQSSGQVNVSANSVANPYGYWSDSMYIR